MTRKFLFGLMLFVFLMTGCATARVWQNEKSDTATSEMELQAVLNKCEQTGIVADSHKKAEVRSNIGTGTVWIPFVGLAMVITGDSLAAQYIDLLTICMHDNNFYHAEKRSGRLKWNKLSDFDISMERWNEEYPGDKLALTRRTPSSDAAKRSDTSKIPDKTKMSDMTKIFTWTSANVRSGPGEEYHIITYVRQGDKVTIIGEFEEWGNVRLENGQEGWVNSRYLE